MRGRGRRWGGPRTGRELDLNDGEARSEKATFQFTRESILRDYRIAFQSREASLLARKEVLTGKAKFGIFGDGKEVAQVALARAMRAGDFRAGYYRDQTVMFALGLLSIEEFFAQVYADASLEREPASAGRQMNAHFATRLLDDRGEWRSQVEQVNVAADLSPTASQMPKLVGLAWASRLYRQLEPWPGSERFSRGGDEIAFGTIGDASCAEGLFWESINAAGVLGAPLLLSIWDDGYGISVPVDEQVTKGSISELLRGFQRSPGGERGYDIYTVKGWDYPGLCETFLTASEIVRREHVPAVIHVQELTQPQGHSTSGSHERYKSPERLAWEREHDGLARMRAWMERQGIATADELDRAQAEDKELVKLRQQRAWERFREPIEVERGTVVDLAARVAEASGRREELDDLAQRLARRPNLLRRDLMTYATQVLSIAGGEGAEAVADLRKWRQEQTEANRGRYGSDLYCEGARSALAVEAVAPVYESENVVNGFELLNACFDAALARHSDLVAFGEDVGRLGDVNQGMAGLQEKYGPLRVSDTGIREATILGQAIGLALRGFRPIAEIQYLDYLLYALQILSDDLATLRWRTRGGQAAPVIVRTRGHRLEGVWHAGSPMSGLLGLIRGIWLCVPRDMTRAAGMYNTLLRSQDPGIVVEVLNGYRVKERVPSNLGELAVPLGVPEVLRAGGDLTIVTYGACCRIVLEAAEMLAQAAGIEAEVIDVQTLLPFDREGAIVASLRRTHRVVFVDEDVPGGATAYMMQQVLEAQDGFEWLDEPPVTITARPHRPAYGSDGDYFSKPNRDTVFEAAYGLMRRGEPARFPDLFG